MAKRVKKQAKKPAANRMVWIAAAAIAGAVLFWGYPYLLPVLELTEVEVKQMDFMATPVPSKRPIPSKEARPSDQPTSGCFQVRFCEVTKPYRYERYKDYDRPGELLYKWFPKRRVCRYEYVCSAPTLMPVPTTKPSPSIKATPTP
jgi:hypothetical protein